MFRSLGHLTFDGYSFVMKFRKRNQLKCKAIILDKMIQFPLHFNNQI